MHEPRKRGMRGTESLLVRIHLFWQQDGWALKLACESNRVSLSVYLTDSWLAPTLGP